MRSPLMSMYEKRIQSTERAMIALGNNVRDNIILSIESYDIYEIYYMSGSYHWPTEDGSIEGKALARVMDGVDAATWYKRNKTNNGWELFGGGSLILIPYVGNTYNFPAEDGTLKQDVLGRLVDGPEAGIILRRNSSNNGWVSLEVLNGQSIDFTNEAIATVNVPQIIGTLTQIGQKLYYKFTSNRIVNLLACYFGDDKTKLFERCTSLLGFGYYNGSDSQYPKGAYIGGLYNGVGVDGAYPIVKSSMNKLERCALVEYSDGRLSYIGRDGTEYPLNWINC